MLPVLYEALKVTIQTDLRLNLWQAACWIENYSSNRSIKVIQSDQSFRIFSINASIPQGSILGPLLFSFFIRDPGNEYENPLYLYADDSTLDGETVTSSLNRDLDRMKSWADKRKVTFEQSKCKTMTTSSKRNPTRRELFFGSTKLAEKNKLEILGVAVDCKLIGTKHVSKSLQERSRSLELDAR